MFVSSHHAASASGRCVAARLTRRGPGRRLPAREADKRAAASSTLRVPLPPPATVILRPPSFVMSESSSSPKRDERVSARVTKEEKAAIEQAADKADRSISAHIRQAASTGSDSRMRVPPINKDVWRDLAPLSSNLNQIARTANRIQKRIDDAHLPDDLLGKAENIAGVLREVLARADELAEQVAALRRDLLGAAPLELAADVLDDYRSATQLGTVDFDPDKLSRVASYLRELAEYELEEG